MNEGYSPIGIPQENTVKKKLFPVRHSNVKKQFLTGVNTNNG